jgi:hypothetical protein
MFMEETALCAALNLPPQTCPEILSTIYATHYRHVLRVCRRFFPQPQDAEDAAADVFLKLCTGSWKQETRRCPSALGCRRWQDGIASTSCDEENARKIRAWTEPTLAKSPTIQLLRHSPKFCAGKKGSQ